MRTLNVLHISSMGKIGGIESRLIDFFNHSLPGFQFFLFSPVEIPSRWRTLLTVLKIPFKNASNNSWEKELLDYVLRNKIDIAHFHQPYVNAIKLLKSIGLKAVIYHDHGASWYGSTEEVKNQSKILKTVDGILAVSQASRCMLIERFKIPASLIRVIHNGVDFKQLNIQQKIVKPKDKKIVTTVCRLKPFKGVDSFICTYPHVCKIRKDVEFWIIGHGPERKELESLANQLGIVNQVRFWGFQNSVGDFLRVSDLFVLPSYREPFAGALIEAGFIAKPCIALNVDGNPEIIVHNETGILIEPTIPVRFENDKDTPALVVDGTNKHLRKPMALDPCQLGQIILRMLDNPEISSQMGLRARQTVKKYYNVDRYRKDLATYYIQFVDGHTD